MERLEALCGRRLQRVGLSATQRPLDEVARYLGGIERPSATVRKKAARRARTSADAEDEIHDEFGKNAGNKPATFRPVTIVDAGVRRPIKLTVEVPVEDMSRIGDVLEVA